MSTFTSFTTVGGWATIFAVAGGIYYISSRKEKSKRPASTKQSSKPLEPKKDNKVKKDKTKKTAPQSDGDSGARSGPDNKKKTKKPASAKAQPAKADLEAPTYAVVANDKDEEADNREFAHRMAATKTGGAIAAPKSKSEARQKSVKQSRAQEKQVVEISSDNITAPSSANGGDADDDQSPINSPDLSATTVESPIHGGVADMLEKPAAGPSVLKISAPTNPAPTKKQTTQAALAPVESKKQRQNRQKAEAQKAARAADEAERQKLMEQTRRNARVAEGRAAKDGSNFMASKAPTTSSWTAPPPTTNGTSAPSKKVELLDTTHDKPAEAASSGVVYSPSQEAGSKWETALSEEEQIRIITENENWETVKKDKKKGPKKPTEVDQKNPSKKATEEISADESQDFGVPPRIAPTGAGKKWVSTLVHVEDQKIVEREVELQDDEWEVS